MLLCDPATTALVIVDMQECFVDSQAPFAVPGAHGLFARVNQLAAGFRASGSLVIHTRHVLRSDHSNGGTLPDLIGAVADGMIDEDAPAARLHKELEIRDEDLVVDKPRFSALASTDLELILRRRRIETLVLGGVETQICVESTARDAADRGFRVVVVSDCTAGGLRPDGGHSTDAHRASLSRISSFFGLVATADDVMLALEQGRRGDERP